MIQRDSRRLRSANFLWDRPCAILDVGLEPREDGEALVRSWRAELGRVLSLVSWQRDEAAARVLPGSAMFALSAPMDALLAATEVNEWVFASIQRCWKQITGFKPQFHKQAPVAAAVLPLAFEPSEVGALSAGMDGLVRDERGVRLARELED